MPDVIPPLIDAHCHIFTRAMPFAPDAHARPAYEYPVEAWLTTLDRFGIARGVIAAASLYGDHNDYTLAALDAHDRLRATIIVRPETDAATLRALAARGVVGVRLQWRRMTSFPDFAADPWRGFLRDLRDNDLHVELIAANADLAQLIPALSATGVKLVVDHFAVPARDTGARGAGVDAALRAAQQGSAWIKVSAGFRIPDPILRETAARLLAEAGPDRLIWGSDAPFVNHEAEMDYARALALHYSLFPDAAVRRRIDRTALDLFFPT